MIVKQKITMSYDCHQNAMKAHKHESKHDQVEIKRFKIEIDQFLSIDDWMWQDALAVTFKIDAIVQQLTAYKESAMQAVYDKKLLYALGFQNQSQIYRSFSLARDSQFNKLTCNQINHINDKIKKERKINEKEIKKITCSIIDKTKKDIDKIVNEVFNQAVVEQKKVQIKKEIKRQQPVRRQIQRQQIKRQEKKPVNKIEQGKNKLKIPQNEYPLIKINQIQEFQGSFNITIKVLKIIKKYTIKNKNSIQFEGGDETGLATIVLNDQDIVKPDAVISISHARIYIFHGSKQIQMDFKRSKLYQEDFDIKVNDNYHLSKRNKEEYQRQQRGEQNRPEKRYRNRNNQRRPRQDRPPREQRPQQDRMPREYRGPREERGPRENRGPREDRGPRQDRSDRLPNRDYRDQRQDRPTRQNMPIRQEIRQPRRQPRRQPARNQERQRRDRDLQRPDRIPVNNVRYNRENDQPDYIIQREKERNNNKNIDKSSESQQIQQFSKIKQSKLPILPANLVKIAKIQPGDEDITIIAQIIDINIQVKDDKGNLIKPSPDMMFCKIGDQTAIIRAQLSAYSAAIKEGAVIRITFMNAEVNEQDKKITLVLTKESQCERTTIKMAKINVNLNISQYVWLTDEQDNDEQQSSQEQKEKQKKAQPIVEDF